MKKLIVMALIIMLVLFIALNNNQASWFGLGSSKNTPSIDNNLANFLVFYDQELNKYKDTENTLQERELFVSAYDILIDNYVHELSDKEVQNLLQTAKTAMLDKEAALAKTKTTVTAKVLTYAALTAMYTSLDPHTEWLDPNEAKMLKNSINGEYEGVGIVLGLEKGAKYVKAISVVDDGPADKAGVKAGDYIYKIDGKVFTAKQINLVANFLKGKKTSKVVLVVKRGKEEKTFTVQRGQVNLKTVYTEVLDKKYAYMRISTFNSNTTAEVRAGLRALNINKEQGLVLDLRSNPGGLLYSSLIIANMFVNKGTLLSVKGRDKSFNMNYYALNKKDVNDNIPIIILVNNMTASAAEILSAALAQTGRALVMGQTSFGKGSVQTVYDLKDGSSAKVTIQLFYTPNGTALQGIGVVPNIALVPFHKNNFYNIRETSYKNYLIAPHTKNVKSNTIAKIDASTCKPYTVTKDHEIGCAVEYFNKQQNTSLATEK